MPFWAKETATYLLPPTNIFNMTKNLSLRPTPDLTRREKMRSKSRRRRSKKRSCQWRRCFRKMEPVKTALSKKRRPKRRTRRLPNRRRRIRKQTMRRKNRERKKMLARRTRRKEKIPGRSLPRKRRQFLQREFVYVYPLLFVWCYFCSMCYNLVCFDSGISYICALLLPILLFVINFTIFTLPWYSLMISLICYSTTTWNFTQTLDRFRFDANCIGNRFGFFLARSYVNCVWIPSLFFRYVLASLSEGASVGRTIRRLKRVAQWY